MKRSETHVREADPVVDRTEILGVLARNIPGAGDPTRYDWLYLRNPVGRARVWLAEDSETGMPIGTSAGHPKKVRVEGRVVIALNLSDFAVDASHRSLGPALRLLRATLAPTAEGEYAFSYDHPSESMLAIYRWIKEGVWVAPVRRYVRLLRVSPTIERRFGRNALSRAVGKTADLVVQARDVLLTRRAIDLSPLEGVCGEEFDRLDERFGSPHAIAATRPSSMVAWRFLEHAVFPHTVLCARRGEELIGFLAFRRHETENAMVLADLRTREPSVARTLMAELLARARAAEVDAVWARTIEGTPAARLLTQLRFSGRETSPGHVVYAPHTTEQHPVRNVESWWMLDGDRDF